MEQNWRKATEYVIKTSGIPMTIRFGLVPDRMERPFCNQEEGEAHWSKYGSKKGR